MTGQPGARRRKFQSEGFIDPKPLMVGINHQTFEVDNHYYT